MFNGFEGPGRFRKVGESSRKNSCPIEGLNSAVVPSYVLNNKKEPTKTATTINM